MRPVRWTHGSALVATWNNIGSDRTVAVPAVADGRHSDWLGQKADRSAAMARPARAHPRLDRHAFPRSRSWGFGARPLRGALTGI